MPILGLLVYPHVNLLVPQLDAADETFLVVLEENTDIKGSICASLQIGQVRL
jgi:hypothetical protein